MRALDARSEMKRVAAAGAGTGARAPATGVRTGVDASKVKQVLPLPSAHKSTESPIGYIGKRLISRAPKLGHDRHVACGMSGGSDSVSRVLSLR